MTDAKMTFGPVADGCDNTWNIFCKCDAHVCSWEPVNHAWLRVTDDGEEVWSITKAKCPNCGVEHGLPNRREMEEK